MINNTCTQCSQPFIVEDEDLEFYKKISPTFAGKVFEIPSPTLCPKCRHQRRLTWRGEKKFYSRNCDLCEKQLVTVFYPDQNYKVYCPDCWWSDKWNPQESGRDYDFTRPFFEQYEDLIKSTPLLSSWKISCENSEYNNNISYCKNCYLLSSSNYDEDSYYGYYLNDSKDCVDCNSVKKSELIYDGIECINCYNCQYSQNCVDCTDSYFLKNCRNCKNCFGCIDMTQKENCYFNEQLTKEEYQNKISQLNLGRLSEIKRLSQMVAEHHIKFPNRYMVGEKNEDVTGNVVYESKNSHACFDCMAIENCKYCHQMTDAKDCMDLMTWGRPAELLYECQAVGSNAYLNKFCNVSQDCRENIYCYDCMFSKNLFGCVAIKHGEYCILNKQYTKEEYEQLASKIIEHMKQTGEWGEFAPSKLSPFCYNEAVSNDWMPLTKDEALAQNQKWRDPDPKDYQAQTYNVPDNIAAVNEEIISQILACKICEQNYKITPQELVYYKTHIIPVPDICPTCRNTARMHKRNPRHLWHRQCMNEGPSFAEATGGRCQNEFETTYAPDRPEKVYCESCYQESVL